MPAYHRLAQVDQYFEPWKRRASRYGVRFNTDLLMRTDLQTYLSENCLVKTDRASMLASLEVRVPFLDNAVLDRIVPLPPERKIANGQLKAMLLPIAKRILPKEVWDRPKHGFNVPLDTWLKASWRPAVEVALDWGEANTDLFNFRYLRRLHKINMREGGVGRELWNPFVFLAWAMARKVRL
jgi:asparagine synthase (glutamine-hydrolysing)